jgi:hypothetical protein
MKTIEIAPGVTVGDWMKLRLDSGNTSADWELAIQIFEKRIRYRFINPVKYLLEMENNLNPKERRNGFSIMAILCVLIESLQCFAEGKGNSKGISKEVFVRFLVENEPFKTKLKVTKDVAETIFVHVRCGILHQAEITGGTRLRAVGPAVKLKNGKLILNRTKFANGIFQFFEQYILELRKSGENGQRLRNNLKNKFETIIENCA